MFAFLRQKYNSRFFFDPTYPAINMNDFKECKWKGFYVELKEAIPPNDLEERRKEVYLCVYVDSNHAGERKQGGLAPVFRIFEYFANSMVLQ